MILWRKANLITNILLNNNKIILPVGPSDPGTPGGPGEPGNPRRPENPLGP